jgi:hypothetical protein
MVQITPPGTPAGLFTLQAANFIDLLSDFIKGE